MPLPIYGRTIPGELPRPLPGYRYHCTSNHNIIFFLTPICSSLIPHSSFQIGALVMFAITPVVVHSDLTDSVCNSSAPPDSAAHAQWSDEIYTQFSYLLLVQAGIAVLLILPALFGKAVCACCVSLSDVRCKDTHTYFAKCSWLKAGVSRTCINVVNVLLHMIVL